MKNLKVIISLLLLVTITAIVFLFITLDKGANKLLITSDQNASVSNDKHIEILVDQEEITNTIVCNDGDLSDSCAGAFDSDAPAEAQMSSIEEAIQSISPELKTSLQQVLQLDENTFELFSELVSNKIKEENITMAVLSSIAVEPENITLITIDEYSLSSEQLEARQRVLNQISDLENNLEVNRVKFEDSINNLLSPEQKTSLKNFEQEIIAKDRERYIERTISGLNSVPNLSENQKFQLDQLVNEYEGQSLSEVPLGVALNTPGGQLTYSKLTEMKQDFGVAFLQVLTPEQKSAYWSEN